MNKVVLKNLAVGLAVMSVMCLALSSCGGKKKMTICVASENIATYRTGFKGHFDVEMFDASQCGGQFAVAGARYHLVETNGTEAPDTFKPVEGAFLIIIRDEGKSVVCHLVYTSGTKAENPTIVNPIFIEGKIEVRKTLNFVPSVTQPGVDRAKAIATLLYNALGEIEGK
jgi:hypothetical protein